MSDKLISRRIPHMDATKTVIDRICRMQATEISYGHQVRNGKMHYVARFNVQIENGYTCLQFSNTNWNQLQADITEWLEDDERKYNGQP